MSEMEIGLYFSSALAVLAGVAATFLGGLRKPAFALWICGLSVGAIYLSVGMELLAVTQWIVSTLVGISFVFFSVMFEEKRKRLPWYRYLIPFGVGGVFIGVVWMGMKNSPSLREPIFAKTGIVELGALFLREHVLSVILLGLTLLLVMVGSGVVSRLESDR